ncbi:helix-turn-helix domain-containing protein [Gracilibacillus salitolerans]|uniref:Helix-turn-helix domain-containing protein n=1 Tax=Gracilibacillus salitolerans TaxID=2663022 RepID=A0A5Q2TKK9_9BACI|nr:helix-turn-helix transcriptional regulator [Gracilibacillus salitolerans]QGH35175.1 helix-turn-helix domain-containing protein [Gracilibacillus salitolerans]
MNVKITPKGLRVSNGLNQEEVAEHLGISLTQYRRKENGKVRFYADEIYKLSKLYDVPIAIFFTDEVSYKDTNGVNII